MSDFAGWAETGHPKQKNKKTKQKKKTTGVGQRSIALHMVRSVPVETGK